MLCFVNILLDFLCDIFHYTFQMKVLCPEYLNSNGQGHMEECLKLQFDANKLKPDCQIHIAHIIETQRADIHVDPVLNAACGVDDSKYCDQKERGHRKFGIILSFYVFYEQMK